ADAAKAEGEAGDHDGADDRDPLEGGKAEAELVLDVRQGDVDAGVGAREDVTAGAEEDEQLDLRRLHALDGIDDFESGWKLGQEGNLSFLGSAAVYPKCCWLLAVGIWLLGA